MMFVDSNFIGSIQFGTFDEEGMWLRESNKRKKLQSGFPERGLKREHIVYPE